jgi:hypothetical protein
MSIFNYPTPPVPIERLLDPKNVPYVDYLTMSEQFKDKKPTIVEAQGAVFARIADHVKHIPSAYALGRLNWYIHNKCDYYYRYELLLKLATMSITDAMELNYLIEAKRRFKHIEKFSRFYKALKIMYLRNRQFKVYICEFLRLNLCESVIQCTRRFSSTHISEESNFLLDFGFVESVGSGIAIVKGLLNVRSGELVFFYPNNVYGLTLTLSNERVGIVLC